MPCVSTARHRRQAGRPPAVGPTPPGRPRTGARGAAPVRHEQPGHEAPARVPRVLPRGVGTGVSRYGPAVALDAGPFDRRSAGQLLLPEHAAEDHARCQGAGTACRTGAARRQGRQSEHHPAVLLPAFRLTAAAEAVGAVTASLHRSDRRTALPMRNPTKSDRGGGTQRKQCRIKCRQAASSLMSSSRSDQVRAFTEYSARACRISGCTLLRESFTRA